MSIAVHIYLMYLIHMCYMFRPYYLVLIRHSRTLFKWL
jgi:hypothetical protein